MKSLKKYRNNKGIVLSDKYHFGHGGENKFYYVNNKDIFCLYFIKFHFFYLKTKH